MIAFLGNSNGNGNVTSCLEGNGNVNWFIWISEIILYINSDKVIEI